MPVMSLLLVAITITLLLFGAPIAVAIGIASFSVLIIFNPLPDLQLVTLLFSQAATTFIFLAVPLFVLAGNLMSKGTMGKKLIDFVVSLVGWAPGGLGIANIKGSMIFGGISGSSLADAATFSTIMVPRMVENGYPKSYAGAVTLTSSCLSVIIPPSILIVLAAATTEQSVARALAGGLFPGLLVVFMLLIPNYIITKKYGYGHKIAFSLKNVVNKLVECWTAIIAPLIVLGSIFTGFVTPTEGAALAVFWVLVVDGLIYKKLKINDILYSLKSTAILTSSILFIITSTAVANWVLAYEQVPKKLASLLGSMTGGNVGVLLLMGIILILIGMVVDAGPATIIFGPLFLPIAVSLGIDPTHFLIILVTGLALGLTTPPYGVCLFCIASVARIQINKLVISSLPFYGALIVAFLLIIIFPQITLIGPKLFGL